MDATDFSVVRYMCPGGVLRAWGSRPIVDPRITPHDIGAHVGLSAVAVRARIAQLRRRGILLGEEVWPNPLALGIRFENAGFRLARSRSINDVLDRFRGIEGMISAQVVLDRGRRQFWVTYVRDRPMPTARRIREISLLCGSGPVRAPAPLAGPICRRRLSPTEWRVIGALRADPSASLARQSAAARLSPKTFARHFHALLDEGALLWTRKFDNSKWPGAIFYLFLRSPGDRERVLGVLDTTVPAWIPIAAGGLSDSLHSSPPWVGGSFFVPTPIACEELEERLGQIPGVRRVFRRIIGRVVDYPSWFDARIQEQLGNAPRLGHSAQNPPPSVELPVAPSISA